MEPIVRSRVLPRVSFRTLMIATVFAALIAAAARAAGNGVVVLKAVMLGLIMLTAVFALAMIAFLISWIMAKLIHGKAADALQGNPFAEDRLPPQQIKPRDPTNT